MAARVQGARARPCTAIQRADLAAAVGDDEWHRHAFEARGEQVQLRGRVAPLQQPLERRARFVADHLREPAAARSERPAGASAREVDRTGHFAVDDQGALQRMLQTPVPQPLAQRVAAPVARTEQACAVRDTALAHDKVVDRVERR